MDWGKYCFYVGTARGVLLSTTSPKDIKISKHESASEVTSLIFGRSDSELILGYKNGDVSLYNSESNTYGKNLTKLNGEGPVTGLGVTNDKAVIIGKRDGIVNIWNGKKTDFFSINLDEKGTLDSMVYNFNRNAIGTGGEFNDYKVWDAETKQCIFRAKSMGHDELQLPIPTSIGGISFLAGDDHLAVCATKEGHVLLYDERAQRRPVVKFLEKKASFTCIASTHRERQVLVGSTKGYMQLLDMKAGKCLKTFMSFTGSVTSIVCDPIEPIVASTSLDRFLRIHNLESKELLHKVYLKQNLSRVLIKPIIKEENEEEEGADTVQETNALETTIDEEYEELFKNMEEIQDGGIKKVKKTKKKHASETDIIILEDKECNNEKKRKDSTSTDVTKSKKKKKIKL